FAGALVFLYITVEAPLSGMSINPARTAASAVPSGVWTSSWVYFTAPFLGMFAAAQLYGFLSGSSPRACPKYHHGTQPHCISGGTRGKGQAAAGNVRGQANFCQDCPQPATH